MHFLARITVTIKATQSVAWPHFAGSTLRGAFGRALRKASCITGQSQCTGCPLRNSCAYGVVFDPAAPSKPPHPSFNDGLPRYLIAPPKLGACDLKAGQTQQFSLLLLPGTQLHYRLIEHTLRNAVEKELIQPGIFQLLESQTQQIPVKATLAADSHSPSLSATPKRPSTNQSQISLHWQTPLRLQSKGKPIFKAQQLDATTLVSALLRRQMQWHQLIEQAIPDSQTPLDAARACKIDTERMKWHDMSRFSSTQNGKIPMGGLLGTTTLIAPTDVLSYLLPLLQLGQQLNIGKETVMGMGNFQPSAIQSN
jgi:CRISPR-associated endoribonuclease Cas6